MCHTGLITPVCKPCWWGYVKADERNRLQSVGIRVADVESRRRLRSASTDELIIQSMRLSTVGDRAFHVATARTCNSLPLHVTSAPSKVGEALRLGSKGRYGSCVGGR